MSIVRYSGNLFKKWILPSNISKYEIIRSIINSTNVSIKAISGNKIGNLTNNYFLSWCFVCQIESLYKNFFFIM